MSFGPQVFWDRELCIEILKVLAIQMYNRIISILNLLYGHDTSPKFSDKCYGLGLFCSIKKICIDGNLIIATPYCFLIPLSWDTSTWYLPQLMSYSFLTDSSLTLISAIDISMCETAFTGTWLTYQSPHLQAKVIHTSLSSYQ